MSKFITVPTVMSVDTDEQRTYDRAIAAGIESIRAPSQLYVVKKIFINNLVNNLDSTVHYRVAVYLPLSDGTFEYFNITNPDYSIYDHTWSMQKKTQYRFWLSKHILKQHLNNYSGRDVINPSIRFDLFLWLFLIISQII